MAAPGPSAADETPAPFEKAGGEGGATKRLRPLFVASFLQSVAFWYAIEKLLMHRTGLTDGQIVLAGIVLSLSLLLFQIPSGILADRHSRRGALIVASLFLIASTVVGTQAYSKAMFYLSDALWGVFAAIAKGTDDAIIYDTLLEEEGDASGFTRHYGRLQIYDGVGFIIGSLLGSVIGDLMGLRAAYWLSLPCAILSIPVLLRLKEPTLHKQGTSAASALTQTIETVKSVARPGPILWITVPMVMMAMADRMLFNIPNLWWIALSMPVLAYGPAYAILHVSVGISGAIAKHLRERPWTLTCFGLVVAASGLGLVWSRSLLIVVAVQMVLLTGYEAYAILLAHQLHDRLPSRLRSGSSSAVGTLSQMAFLPVAYIFGLVCDSSSVFVAAWVIVAVSGAAVFIANTRALGRGVSPLSVPHDIVAGHEIEGHPYLR